VTRNLLCACGLVFVCALVSAAPDDELPDGDGKRILMASCTSCHELDEVTKFRGYYTKAQWRDIVKTMVEYGAAMKKGEDEVLVDYLTQHLGKKN
jgi:cytochrome c5